MQDLELILRAIFEQSGVGVAQVEAPSGRFIEVNQRLADLLGYSLEELRTLGFPQLTHPDDLEGDYAMMRRVVEGEVRGFTREKRYLRKDGGAVWVNVTVSPLWKPGEAPTSSLTLIEDISLRKRVEAELGVRLGALQVSEGRFRALVQNAPDGFELHDEEGHFVDVNSTSLAQLGYTREEMLRMSVFDIDPDVSREHFADVMREASRAPLRLESTHRRKDGTVFPVEVTISTMRIAGDLRVLTLVRDITERRRAQQALRDSEERYRLLFDNLTDAVFVHGIEQDDTPGRFEAVNDAACQRLGYTREELLSLGPSDIDARESSVDVRAVGQRLRRGESLLFEQVHVAKDGTHIPVEIGVHAFPLADGHQGVLSVVRDVTERRKAEREREELEKQFQQAQKMESIGRLAGGVAHDFNNMLQVILGNVEVLLGQIAVAGDTREALLEIQGSAKRSADLTRQLLAFARRQTIHPRVLDLNDAVSGTLKMLRRLIGEDLKLLWAPGADLWSVEVDPVQIDQILANLVVNARDAMPQGGRVTIETANVTMGAEDPERGPECPAGDFVRLSVRDTGPGIDDEVRQHIFEPFFTTKEPGKGTGLGLATVFGIVRQNLGWLTVESVPGQGAAFQCYLPRAEAPPTTPTPSNPERSLDGTETILLVEDEAQVLRLAEKILENRGYRVLTARTPGAALELASRYSGPVHLLLTDVVMPDMDGRELLRQLALQRPDIKCLFMSGYPAEIVARHGVLDADLELLGKPFTSELLAEKVRAVLSGPSRPRHG